MTEIEKEIEHLREGANKREIRLAVVETYLPEIQRSLSDIKDMLASLDDKYATKYQVAQLERDMNRRFDEVISDIKLRTTNKLGSNIILILITAIITGLIGLAFWEIQHK